MRRLFIVIGGGLLGAAICMSVAAQNVRVVTSAGKIEADAIEIAGEALFEQGITVIGTITADSISGSVSNNLSDLLDVSATTPGDGEVLTYTGGTWTNTAVASSAFELDLSGDLMPRVEQVAFDSNWEYDGNDLMPR